MDDIKRILAGIMKNSSFSEPFFEGVLNRLDSFGYKAKEEDAWSLSFAMQKVENHIKNFCNVSSVPEGLFNIAVDMVCGEFLFAKKQTGQLTVGELDLSCAIEQISEGDTTVTFGDGTSDEDKFTMLLNHLMNKGEGDFICFRKLKW